MSRKRTRKTMIDDELSRKLSDDDIMDKRLIQKVELCLKALRGEARLTRKCREIFHGNFWN